MTGKRTDNARRDSSNGASANGARDCRKTFGRTKATAGGGLLIVDLGVRLLLTSVFEVSLPSRLFQITAWAYFLWSFLLGPGLLLLAFTRRARRQPTHIYALQFVQVIAWALACFVSLFVAALSGP